MNSLTFISILIVGILLWVVWSFVKYKNNERMDKNEIYSYLRDGLSLGQALKTAFSNLNKYETLNLREATIDRVSSEMANLEKTMSVDNVIESYSTFIHRYIYRDGSRKNPKNLSDQKILYALGTLDFDEHNGYFLMKADKDDEFHKKYPD